MADAFGVTTDEMVTAASDVASATEELNGVLSSLQSTVAGVQGLWAGQAATQFNTLMESLDAAGQKINAALDEIGQNLAGSAANYAQIEEEQASAVGGIGGRLEGL